MSEDDKVSRIEFEAFAKAVRDKTKDIENSVVNQFQDMADSVAKLASLVNKLAEKSSEREGAGVAIYRCRTCSNWSTADVAAYIDHSIKHRFDELKRTLTEASESNPRRQHTTPKEIFECSECRPKFDDLYLAEGWTKPEEKRYDPLGFEMRPEKKRVCPKCGTELKKGLLGGLYCPKCSGALQI